MKIRTFIIAASSLLALTIHSTLALTVPVAQDANSSITNTITTTVGKAASVAVNSRQTGFFRFALSDTAVVPEGILSTGVSSAMLRLYVITSTNPADISVHTVALTSEDWAETPVPAEPAPPVEPAVIATIPATDLRAKHFVSVDVTAAVKAALNGGNDLSFALQTASTAARITLGSKEGTGTSYSAELEIVAQAANSITNADISSGAAINASKLGTGIVSNTEFNFLNGVASGLQGQLNDRLKLTGGTVTGSVTADSFKIPPRTFVLQLTGNDFVPDTPDQRYDRGAGLIRPLDSPSFFHAGVHLPDGAVVTKLIGVFFTDSGVFINIDLKLRFFSTTNLSDVIMMQVLGDTFDRTGRQELSDSTISADHRVIDNTTRAYVVDANLEWLGNVRFYGVRIEYTLNELLP